MKKLIKSLSLSLIVIMMLGFAAGCSQDNDPKPEEARSNLEIHTDVGFVDNIIREDEKDYIEIGTNKKTLKLEVEDEDILTGIDESEFYKFAYDENNTLLSIEKDDYIKKLVERTMEQGVDEGEKHHISPEDKVSTEDLTLLDSYKFDINGDGFEETIAMYSRVGKDSSGELMWDDGQDWLFIVEGQDQDYILFDDYVQIGSIKFHVYTDEDDFYIVTVETGTANLGITEYKYDKESDEFISSSKYQATGNVNMIHSSFGY